MERKIEIAVAIISAILLLWFFASWYDVIAHNLDKVPVYKSWNLFQLFFKK